MKSFDSWFNQTTRELAEVVEKEEKAKKPKVEQDNEGDFYGTMCPIEADPDYWSSTGYI